YNISRWSGNQDGQHRRVVGHRLLRFNNMKYILSIILFLCVGIVNAQNTHYQKISTPYQYRHVLLDSVLGMPFGDVPVLRQIGGHDRPGQIFYNTTDSTVYVWTGTQFIKIVRSTGGEGVGG